MYSGSVLRSISLDMPLPDLDKIDGIQASGAVRRYCSSRMSTNLNERILPCFESRDEVVRISKETMAGLLKGKWSDRYDKLYIIDCRYPYEYEGGHLPKAINVNEPGLLNEMFFKSPVQRAVIIFHCEYSHDRGPTMAKLFRNFDRKKNEEEWPRIDYPDTYVLDGGYRGFYSEYPELCDGGYVEMRDDKHTSNGDLVKANSSFKWELEKIADENRENRERQMFLKNLDAKKTKSVIGFQSPILPKRIQSHMTARKYARKSLHICNL